MNKNIKKLIAESTWVQFAEEVGYKEVFDKEKFAQLIVKECLEQVCDEVQYEYDWKLADAVSKRVLEHFGV
jgi:hypothetical protein